MRTLGAVTLAVALVSLAPAASATRATVRGPWLLVSLAALGTVTWRCDASRHPGVAPGLPALALGFRSFTAGQSGSVRLRAHGRTVLARSIEPGRAIRLPFVQARVQQLRIAEWGEDGTLRAFVTVDFAPRATSGYCWPYLPPRVDIRLLPRR